MKFLVYVCVILIPNLFICNAEIFDALKKVLIINRDEYSSTIFPPNLSYSDEVRLRHPRVKVLTVELQAPIANVKTFRATNGSIETLHLMENLRAVQIYNCSTSEPSRPVPTVWKLLSLGAVSSYNNTVLVIRYDADTDPIFPPNLDYKKYEKIEMQIPRANILTTEMQSTISHMRMIFAAGGSLEIVELQANFENVLIQNCNTSSVIIHPHWDYKVAELKIIYSKLEELPANINVLKRLKILLLNDNKIGFIQMADFNGLNLLETLSLPGNKMREISATLQNPVILPKLKEFYADRNRLVDIDFKHWYAPVMNDLRLFKNQLQIALSLLDAFPVLKNLHIHTNPWNCQWLSMILKESISRKVTVWYKDSTKCNETGPPLDYVIQKIKLQQMIPMLKNSQNSPINGIFNKFLDLESTNGNLTANIGQLQKETELLQKDSKEIKTQLNEILASTRTNTIGLKNAAQEFKNEVRNLLEIVLIKEQQLRQHLNKSETFIKTELESMHKSKLSNTLKLEELETTKNDLITKVKLLEEANQLLKNDANVVKTQLRALSANTSAEATNLQQENKDLRSELGKLFDKLETLFLVTHQLQQTDANLTKTHELEVNRLKKDNDELRESSAKRVLQLEEMLNTFALNSSIKLAALEAANKDLTIKIEHLEAENMALQNQTGNIEDHLRQISANSSLEASRNEHRLKEMLQSSENSTLAVMNSILNATHQLVCSVIQSGLL